MHEEDEKRVGFFFWGGGGKERTQAQPQLEMSKICLKAGTKGNKLYHRVCSNVNNKETEQVVTKFVKCGKT